MEKLANSFILEGVDRTGKGTLIKRIKDEFGFHQVIHYEKPEMLALYRQQLCSEWAAQQEYQARSFIAGFKMLESGAPLIYDRFHLGETVYSPRYRGYSGDYVFDLEFVHLKRMSERNEFYIPKLILLTTSDFSFIKDDGLSFDFSKKEEEQEDFKKAFHRSQLPKVMIDVSNGKGGFRDPDDIFEEAMNEFFVY